VKHANDNKSVSTGRLKKEERILFVHFLCGGDPG